MTPKGGSSDKKSTYPEDDMSQTPEVRKKSTGVSPDLQSNPGLELDSTRHPQPAHVWKIAFIDMWERFSFYSTQALLAFYLLYSLADGGLALNPVTATAIIGAYGACVQLAQVVGSWIADRLVPPKKMVMAGGFIVTVGHIALAVLPGLAGVGVGLVLIIIGTGAFKTNLTTILGMLYEASDTRRDAGFTIYFTATNVGSILGPLLAGLTQSVWGFHAGFGIAAIGMVAGLIQFRAIYSRLPSDAGTVRAPLRSTAWRGIVATTLVLLALVALLAQLGWLSGDSLSTTMGVVIIGVIFAYFTIMFRSREVSSTEKVRLRGLIPLCIAATVFFGFTLQVFTTVPVFIGKSVDPRIGSLSVPAVWFVTTSAVAFVVVSPAVSYLWATMGPRQPSATSKMCIAFILVGLGYLGLALSASAFESGTIPAILVIGCLALTGVAEIFMGPIVLSIGSRAMPTAFKSQGLAVMVLSIGGGSVISGFLGGWFTKMSESMFFFMLTGIAISLAVVLLVINRPVSRLLNFVDK
ncbi:MULTISPECIES: peptide MFS transporter [Nocardiaceae]|uniref:peptide MFS transporter n=1 Tax=Nocardiaceae TaxID=85025 RepID=UPI0011401E6A|nr:MULTISPECIES: oligopeptide:H+ symporter [Rhodococcus]